MAADRPARVMAELSPKDGAWVGQRVTLAITLATPDLFAGAPSFDMPPIPGAVVLPPAGSPVIGSETIGELTYTTQRHEFAVFAQRAEVVRIPAFAIQFESNAGFGTPVITRQLTTEALSFTAKTPPGAEGLGTVIAARNLRATDLWQPEPKAPKVGDALTRTLSVTADDVPGMVFPSFRVDGINGLAAYPKEPAVNDHTERGSLTGQRIETITYVCETGGTVTIPDRTLTWFDLDTNELKTTELPGRTFAIASIPEPALTPDPAAPAPNARAGWRRDVAATCAIVVLGGILMVLWPRCLRAYGNWTESEPACFARLRRACRSDDPHAVFVAHLHWLDRLGPMSLDEFARRTDDPKLTGAIAAIADRVYTRPGARSAPWSGGERFTRIALARRRLRFSTARPEAYSLPPLNPVG
jgi:hypothetical protein